MERKLMNHLKRSCQCNAFHWPLFTVTLLISYQRAELKLENFFHVHVCEQVHVCACMYVHICVCVQACVYAHTCASPLNMSACVWMYVHWCMHVCTCIHACMCMGVQASVCMNENLNRMINVLISWVIQHFLNPVLAQTFCFRINVEY